MRVPFLWLLSHRAVGADIFISYRQAEAREYAAALKQLLEQKHRCYLDEEHLDGDEVEECLRAARRSRMFVLVGTSTIFDSTYIPREIEAYLGPRRRWPRRLWRRFLPINVGGALDDVKRRIDEKTLAPVWQPVVDFVGEPERQDALKQGPSASVVQHIENAYDLLSASFFLMIGAVLLSAAIGAATWGAVQLAIRSSARELRQLNRHVEVSQASLNRTNAALTRTRDDLDREREELKKTADALAHQREELHLTETGRQASAASILALQFLSDLGVHPPNGKARDNRDERALAMAVRAARRASTVQHAGPDSVQVAEDAINSAMADVLTAMNYSYRFRGHPDRLVWLRPIAGTGLLISRGDDGRHLVWDPDRPERYRELEDVRSSATELSASGRYMVLKNEASVEVRELASGAKVAVFEIGTEPLTPVLAVADDGRTVLRQGLEGLEVWDATLGTHFTIPGTFVKAVAFRDGTRTAVALTTQNGLEIVDLEQRTRTPGEAIGLSPWFTLSTDGELVVWTAPTTDERGETQLVTFGARISPGGSLAGKTQLLQRDFPSVGLSSDAGFFTADRKLLAVPGKRGRVSVFSTGSWKPLFEHSGPPFRIDQIAVRDSASRLVTVSSEEFRDGLEVRVWNSAHVRPFREEWGVDATAYTADWREERLEPVERDGAYTLVRLRADSREPIAVVDTRLPFRPVFAAISADGTTGCVLDDARGLHVWRAGETLRQVATLESVLPVRPALSPDGRRIVLADKGSVSIIDTRTNERTPLAPPSGGDAETYVSSRGTWAVTRSIDLMGRGADGFTPGTISVWRVPEHGGRIEVTTRIPSLFYQEPFAAISDDGASLAIAQNDGTVKLYRHDATGRERPRLLATFRPPRNPYGREPLGGFTGLRFTPDGSALVVAYGGPSPSSRVFPTDVTVLQEIAGKLQALQAER